MFDGAVRKTIDPLLLRLGSRLAAAGISANTVTVSAWAVGVVAALLIAFQFYVPALAMILLSRLADGLDGAVARAAGTTDFGGYIDIVLDFFFYGAIPFAFIVSDPHQNATAGAALIFSFYFNGSTFLAYAVFAEKLGLKTDIRGVKSVYFTTGLAEATETIAVFVFFCLFPSWFPVIAFVFAGICFWTAFSRILHARRELRRGQ